MHTHVYGEDARLQPMYDSLDQLEQDLRSLGIAITAPVREEWEQAQKRFEARYDKP